MVQELLQLNSHACIDIPDKSNYKFSEVFVGAVDKAIPRRVLLNNTHVQNQGIKRTPSTAYGCVFFTESHIVNEENFLEYQSKGALDQFHEIDAFDTVKDAIQLGLLNPNSGAAIQSGPKHAIKRGYSDGYTLISALNEYKQSLAMKQGVQVGTASVNWAATFAGGGVIVPGTSYGHSLFGAGYDDDYLGGCAILRNSYGEDAPNGGYLFLKYSDFGILYESKYAYVDKENSDVIKDYQKKKRLELANLRGYWNYQRPNDLATRYEASRMAIRMSIFFNKKVPESIIWNGKDGNAYVTIDEVKAMFERATGSKFTFDLGAPKNTISRSDLAALTVRIGS